MAPLWILTSRSSNLSTPTFTPCNTKPFIFGIYKIVLFQNEKKLNLGSKWKQYSMLQSYQIATKEWGIGGPNMGGWPFVAVRFVTHNVLRVVSPLLGASFRRSVEWTVRLHGSLSGWLKGNTPTLQGNHFMIDPRSLRVLSFCGGDRGSWSRPTSNRNMLTYDLCWINLIYMYIYIYTFFCWINLSLSTVCATSWQTPLHTWGFSRRDSLWHSSPILFQKCIFFQVSSPDWPYWSMSLS